MTGKYHSAAAFVNTDKVIMTMTSRLPERAAIGFSSVILRTSPVDLQICGRC